MARDIATQKTANYGGFAHDLGFATFVTTGKTVSVTTNLSKIYSYSINPASTLVTTDVQNFWLEETIANGEITVADGVVTLERAVEGSGTRTSGLTVTYHFIGVE